MLEVNANCSFCGYLKLTNEVVELYCHKETGLVMYEDGISGDVGYIGELSLENPLPIPELPEIKEALEEGKANAVGIVTTDIGFIAILEDEKAEKRTFSEPFTKGNGETFPVDLDCVLDADEYDELICED